jgi:uncharacterized lipoprotein YddW (UPF0748 family)
MQRIVPTRRLALLALLLLAGCTGAASTISPAPSPAGDPEPIAAPSGPQRAIWVTRFDYRTPDDVRRIFENCASAGFDTVLFQVRGNATAFYRSRLEPWAEQFGFKDPGFDPLALAVEEARRRGLRLHAWVNVMPVWWGTKPPADPRQLWNAHPEWAWYDQHGKRQAFSERFYVSLNPCLPEVREHLVAVVREIARGYAVDGIHLDYIRYPKEPPATPKGSDSDWTRDARTVERFRSATGKDPARDRAAWDAWRTEQVTQVVRALRAMLREERPGVQLSAAVGAEPERHVREYFQDARTWMREGLVDTVYPMNYASDLATFERRAALWRSPGGGARVVMGIMLRAKDLDVQRGQIEQSARDFDGWSLFAYALLWPSPGDELEPLEPAARERRERLRAELVPWLAAGRPAAGVR